MDKNGSVIVLFVLLIVVFVPSDAFNSRKLVTISDPNQDSSSSSPPPPGKTGDSSPVGAPKSKDEPITNGSDLGSKGVNGTYTKEGSSDKDVDTVKNEDGKGLKTLDSESCKKNPVCNDQGKTLMACVQDFENGTNNLTLFVKNEQDVDLKVNITFGSSNNYSQTFELPAQATEKVNITLSGDKSCKVILNAGNGDCELQITQLSAVNSVNKPADSPTKPKDVNPADTPAKPKNVDNPADTPAKPKDVGNPADTPVKPKDVNNHADSKTKPKDVDNKNDPVKKKDDNTPAKSKDANSPPKSNGVDDQSKSEDVDDQSKAKEVDDQSQSKEADDPTQSKSKDNELSKSTPTSLNAPVSKNNVFDQLTFYSKQVTPMHGAYLAFLVALVIGGSWALCSIRKRRTGGGVPYQELEMGPSESSNAVHVETAGWDQDWDDDDWDEDKAIRSPGGSHAKTISSNGLTSRATKKDDWDANWDD